MLTRLIAIQSLKILSFKSNNLKSRKLSSRKGTFLLVIQSHSNEMPVLPAECQDLNHC